MPREQLRERYEEARRTYLAREQSYRRISAYADLLRAQMLEAFTEFVAAGQALAHAAARGEE